MTAIVLPQGLPTGGGPLGRPSPPGLPEPENDHGLLARPLPPHRSACPRYAVPGGDALELALSFVLLHGALIHFLFRRLQRAGRMQWAIEEESIAERTADRADYESQRQRDLVLAIACSPLGIELHGHDGDGQRSAAWAADVLAHARALEAHRRLEPTAEETPTHDRAHA